MKLAIDEINTGGGVLGKPVAYIEGDSGDTDNKVAPGTVDTLLSQNADVIVGAASSSVTLSVIDKITTAGVTMFSPANTSKKLSTYADKGLYFRDAPSDILQGGVLADTVTGDNHSNVYVLALNDDYGTGLADDFQKAFEEGGGKVVGKKIYDPKAADYGRGRGGQGGRPRRDRVDRLRRVVPHPGQDGRAGRRSVEGADLRRRRQHRQRPRQELRGRQVTNR